MSVHLPRSSSVFYALTSALVLLVALTGCAGRAGAPAEADPPARPAGQLAPVEEGGNPEQALKVVATTSIVGDIVRQVGGEPLDLSVLLPVGADPHGFQPTPQDIARVADADLVFANGAGLEEFLQPLLENAGGEARVVEVSEGIELIEGHEEEDAHEEEHTGDPHTWTDPNNVLLWTRKIEEAFIEVDPENAGTYTENAQRYRQELEGLDAWIREQVGQIPADRRKLVVDHKLFAYFAQTYGFEQVGVIIPSFSTMAEPSAQEIAQLEDVMRELNIEAIFVSTTVNPSLAERIAADTNTEIVRVYTESLSEAGGEADSYIHLIRYNVNAFVNALRP